jgi:predicted GNAT family N-acyltransferase
MNDLEYKFVENENELRQAIKVRKRVFVDEQGIPEDIDIDGQDSSALHMVVQNSDTAVGTARVLFVAPDVAKIERMAVLKAFRRKGIGGNILLFLIKELKNKSVRKVVVHAQSRAASFYESCGFNESGKPFNEVGIPHIKMEYRL